MVSCSPCVHTLVHVHRWLRQSTYAGLTPGMCQTLPQCLSHVPNLHTALFPCSLRAAEQCMIAPPGALCSNAPTKHPIIFAACLLLCLHFNSRFDPG